MRRASIIAAIIFAGTQVASAGPRTIVGQWKMVGQQCTPIAGAIEIGPKFLASDEYMCEFETVSRSGATVTWRGFCQDPYSGMQPTTVVATEEPGGRLYLSYNGQSDPNAPYVRCNGVSGGATPAKSASSRLPLKPGVYVDVTSQCSGASNAATETWNGATFGSSRTVGKIQRTGRQGPSTTALVAISDLEGRQMFDLTYVIEGPETYSIQTENGEYRFRHCFDTVAEWTATWR